MLFLLSLVVRVLARLLVTSGRDDGASAEPSGIVVLSLDCRAGVRVFRALHASPSDQRASSMTTSQGFSERRAGCALPNGIP
jgi:hypothetical protein